jgi:hypothetical protein
MFPETGPAYPIASTSEPSTSLDIYFSGLEFDPLHIETIYTDYTDDVWLVISNPSW